MVRSIHAVYVLQYILYILYVPYDSYILYLLYLTVSLRCIKRQKDVSRSTRSTCPIRHKLTYLSVQPLWQCDCSKDFTQRQCFNGLPLLHGPCRYVVYVSSTVAWSTGKLIARRKTSSCSQPNGQTGCLGLPQRMCRSLQCPSILLTFLPFRIYQGKVPEVLGWPQSQTHPVA